MKVSRYIIPISFYFDISIEETINDGNLLCDFFFFKSINWEPIYADKNLFDIGQNCDWSLGNALLLHFYYTATTYSIYYKVRVKI